MTFGYSSIGSSREFGIYSDGHGDRGGGEFTVLKFEGLMYMVLLIFLAKIRTKFSWEYIDLYTRNGRLRLQVGFQVHGG